MLPVVLLVIYCLLVALGSLAGGWIPLVVRLTHTRMQLAMSFIGGAMLGVGVLHLLPHAFYELNDIQWTAWCVLCGFLATFFLERVFHFHHHDAPDQEGEEHACEHEHEHVHHAHSAHEPPVGISWTAALVGLLLHSVLDGMALAASVMAESRGMRAGGVLGFGVFLAIFLHKPFDSMTLGTLMAMAGRTSFARHAVNFGYALAVPVGVVLFYLGASSFGADERAFIGTALGLAGGTFLCIATSDLLPELQFHSHDRVRLSSALILGVALASLIVVIEERGHDHSAARGDATHDTAHTHADDARAQGEHAHEH